LEEWDKAFVVVVPAETAISSIHPRLKAVVAHKQARGLEVLTQAMVVVMVVMVALQNVALVQVREAAVLEDILAMVALAALHWLVVVVLRAQPVVELAVVVVQGIVDAAAAIVRVVMVVGLDSMAKALPELGELADTQPQIPQADKAALDRAELMQLMVAALDITGAVVLCSEEVLSVLSGVSAEFEAPHPSHQLT
jgi:hypothetical protein